MSYSLDLRQKVVRARVEEGYTIDLITKVFKVTRRTVYIWLERHKKGVLAERRRAVQITRRKVDYNKIAEYVKHNDDKYLWEIGKHFNLGTSTIFYILKKLKITLKKKSPLQKKR